MQIRDKTVQKFLLILIMFASLFGILFYILYCTKFYFSSDMASYLLLASEQLRKHQFFPEGFCYSTGIFIFTAELFIVPLLHFFSDWVLCREIAVIIWLTLAMGLICLFFRRTRVERKAALAPILTIILLCMPMEHYEEFCYDAAYVVLIMYEILIMLALNRIVSKDNCKQAQRLDYIGLFIAVVIANVEGIRNLAVMVLPIIMAVVIYSYIENRKNPSEMFRDRRYGIVIIISILASGLGLLLFKYLAKMVQLPSETSNILFCDYGLIVDNMKQFLTNVIWYYRAYGTGNLLSIGGITACINFVVMITCMVVIPLCMLKYYKRIESNFWKIYVLYVWISNFVVCYMMIFSTANTSRYLFTVYWHNVVLAVVFFETIILRSDRVTSWFVVLALSLSVIITHGNYLVNIVQPITEQYVIEKEQGSLVEYLESNDLTYGFASYWHAYKNMVFSDGKIMFVSWGVGSGNPMQTFYWLTSRDWYDIETHKGRCFVLVAPGEEIPEQYYLVASECKEFQDYKILIYDKNINLYEELH